MFCNNCGHQIAPGATICPNCGTAIAAPQQQYAPQQQQYAPQQQPYAAQQQYAPQQQQYAPQQPYYAPQQPYYAPQKKESGLSTAAKILMIIGTVVMGLYIIPLAWCIPMTISYCNKLKNNEPISTGFKICCLLFVSMIGGILMLCDKEN